MFNWAKKLLSSLDIKKQEKLLRKKHSIEVPRLISQRLYHVNEDTGSFIDGEVTIDDRPFTGDERNARRFRKIQAKQIKDKKPVEVQVPSTAIETARFDKDKGAIYLTYVGGKGKEYVFQGDEKDWLHFMNSGSKGRHTYYVLRQRNQAPKSWY